MRNNKINPLTTLHHVPLFNGLSRRELGRIVAVADKVTFQPGRVLISEGQPGREAFIVLKGMATVKRNGRKIGSVGAGSIVGELALLDNGPRTASVVCDTEVEVLVISQRHFREVLREVPVLAEKLLAALAGRIRDLGRNV